MAYFCPASWSYEPNLAGREGYCACPRSMGFLPGTAAACTAGPGGVS